MIGKFAFIKTLSLLLLVYYFLKSDTLFSVIRQAEFGSTAHTCMCGKMLRDVKYYETPLLYGEDTEDVSLSIEPAGQIIAFCNFKSEVRNKYGIKPGYYESIDKGRTWRFLKGRKPMNVDQLLSLRVFNWGKHPANERVAYRNVKEQHDDSLEFRMFIERSEDGEKSWRRAKAFVKEFQASIERISSHMYHPQNPYVIYVEGEIEQSKNYGIYVSEDGGDTFHLLRKSDKGDKLGEHLTINPKNPNIMYVVGNRGSLMNTLDAGKTWKPVGQNEELRKPFVLERDKAAGRESEILQKGWVTYRTLVIDPVAPEVLYIVSDKGILKTQDGGNHWCVLDLGIENAQTLHNMVIDPKNHNLLYAGTHFGLFKSTDQGCTWQKIEIHKLISK